VKYLVFLLSFLVLTPCSQAEVLEVPAEKLLERNGLKYQVNTDKPFTGIAVSFHESGQWEFKANFKDGKQDGLFEAFYENGQLKMRGNSKDGKGDGLVEAFYENGQLQLRRNFKDGKQVGFWEEFNENGELVERHNFKDGVKIDGEDTPPTEIAPEVAAWLKRAMIHVRKNWVVPPGFRTQTLEARVEVDLDASGGVRGTPRLSRRSGNPWYDEGVIRAIQKSSPLPPPPEAGKWNFVFLPEDSY
jgi:TonB family protein